MSISDLFSSTGATENSDAAFLKLVGHAALVVAAPKAASPARELDCNIQIQCKTSSANHSAWHFPPMTHHSTACGEDIDVRCLGRGRPFVLELKRPHTRRTDLDEIVAAVNANAAEKIEIIDLRWSNRSEVSRVKETRSEKSYNIRFCIEDPPEESAIIEAISSLSGVTLEQQTPKRVSHRRADKKRKRKVVSIDNILVEGNEVQFSVRCEAGTYVKELVHSDEGRTVPSVTSVLERTCEVIWLDVEDIHAD